MVQQFPLRNLTHVTLYNSDPRHKLCYYAHQVKHMWLVTTQTITDIRPSPTPRVAKFL